MSVQPPNEHVLQRLQSDSIIWFTTVRPDGRPHTVPVWFLWENGSVILYSRPNNVKVRNLQHNPNVVIALDNTNDGEDVITVEGKAELLPPNAESGLKAVPPAYQQKYGQYIKNFGWTPESMAADYSQPIRFTPTKFLGL